MYGIIVSVATFIQELKQGHAYIVYEILQIGGVVCGSVAFNAVCFG